MTRPLPLIVISGYLGAGKTTLINQLLRNANGQKIMVLVNDFGAINIDADLLQSADDDTLTLTNGCVCCTMGADLFMALGDALDRQPRPDLLVVEASGIAQPANIANAAKAEPDLRYGGIITVVDAVNFVKTATDAQIGPQVRDQVAAADLLVLSKAAGDEKPLLDQLAKTTTAPVVPANSAGLVDMVLDNPRATDPAPLAHPAYAHWAHRGKDHWELGDLTETLKTPPPGAFRIKGHVMGQSGDGWEIHVVGQTYDISPQNDVKETAIVAIGPRGAFEPDLAEAWWR